MTMMNMLCGEATILTLHRVYPFEEGKLSPNENMKISPLFLENFIQEAKKKGYRFISLDDLGSVLQKSDNSKNLIMTLDDGYSDNFSYAYPIFKKHNVPFTIYLTTSFPEKTANLWWYTLEDLIINNEIIKLSDSTSFNCRNKLEKNETFLKIREKIIALPSGGLERSLDKLFSKYSIDWTSKVKELALSWEEIELMSKDPIVTIGAHTINHLALNSLSSDEIVSELIGCKEAIEAHIGRPVGHFCYPFGSSREVGRREFEIVKNLGFKTATTTRYGHLFSNHANYLEALPRVMLTEDFSWKRLYWRAFNRVLRGRRFVVVGDE